MVNEQTYSIRDVIDANKSMYLNTKASDFKFIMEENSEELPVHRYVLIATSKTFDDMFKDQLKEKNELKIPDVSAKCFKVFLALFYLDEVTINDETYEEIMRLSYEYEMSAGLKICEQFLLRNTNKSMLCKHLGLAITYKLNALQNHCLAEIRANAAHVFKMDGFIESDKNVLQSILNFGDHCCLEVNVFNACLAWAKNNGTMVTDIDVRHELGDLFYLIPFAAMNIGTFSKVVSAHRSLFTLDEVVDIVTLITTGKTTNVSDKFTQERSLVNTFKWDAECLIKTVCTTDVMSWPILLAEYTMFVSNAKMLLGGFDLFKLKNTVDRDSALSFTIIITKRNVDGNDEWEELLQETQHICHAKGLGTIAVRIKLNQPIVIEPNIKYNIFFDFSLNLLTDDYYELRQ